MEKLDRLIEKIKDSEAYQQARTKYDELDSETKLYVNLGALGGLALLVSLSLVVSMAKLHSLDAEINDREESIGYLQRSADAIKQLKNQGSGTGRSDANMPLPSFVQGLLMTNGIDPQKADVGPERAGAQEKDTVESLVDVKLNQVNLKQVQQLLFAVTDQGAARGVNIKDLDVDTKGDESGWMDATFTLSTFKAK